MKKIILANLLILIAFSNFAISETKTDTKEVLNCGGTEPFWDIAITDEKIVFGMGFPTEEGTSEMISKVSTAHGMPNTPDSFLRVYSNFRGPVATVISQKCNDGMSDFIYPKEVILYTPFGTLYGCCGKGVLRRGQ